LYNPFGNNYKSKRLNSSNPTTQGNQQASMLMNGIGRYNANPPQSTGQRIDLMNKLKEMQDNRNKNTTTTEYRKGEVNPNLQTVPKSPTTQKITNIQNQINAGNTLQNVNSVGQKVNGNSTMKHITANQPPKDTDKLTDYVNAIYNPENKTIDVAGMLLNPNQYTTVNGKAYVNPITLGTQLATAPADYTQDNFASKSKMLESMYQPTIKSNESFLNKERDYLQQKLELSKKFQENALNKQTNSINEQRQQASGDLAQALAMRGLDTSGVFSGQLGDMAVNFAKMQNQAMDDNALRSMQIGMENDKQLSDLSQRSMDFKNKIQQQINDQAFGIIGQEGQQRNNLGKMMIDNYNQKLNTQDKLSQQKLENDKFNAELGLKNRDFQFGVDKFNAELGLKNRDYQFGVDKLNAELGLKNRDYQLEVNKFNTELGLKNRDYQLEVNKFNTELGLKDRDYKFGVDKFNAELGLKQQEKQEKEQEKSNQVKEDAFVFNQTQALSKMLNEEEMSEPKFNLLTQSKIREMKRAGASEQSILNFQKESAKVYDDWHKTRAYQNSLSLSKQEATANTEAKENAKAFTQNIINRINKDKMKNETLSNGEEYVTDLPTLKSYFLQEATNNKDYDAISLDAVKRNDTRNNKSQEEIIKEAEFIKQKLIEADFDYMMQDQNKLNTFNSLAKYYGIDARQPLK
jgi:hypothetical protein